MKIILFQYIILFGYVVRNKSIKIPDNCFTVVQGCSAKCYKYYDEPNGHYSSRGVCSKDGGKLAVIKNDATWHLIIENILNKPPIAQKPSKFWLGPWVGAAARHMNHGEGLEKTSFWTSDRLGYDYIHDQCMYAQPTTWQWYLQKCTHLIKLPFLCEYNTTVTSRASVPVPCNASQISIPNANFQFCNSQDAIADGELIKVECWEGFNNKGIDYVTCKNGKWEEPMPKCAPGCKSPGPKYHSKLIPDKSSYDVGEEVAYICDHNYVNWKNYSAHYFIITCQNGGAWSDDDSYCTDEKYTTADIDISNYLEDYVTLSCSLNSDDVSWFHNHNRIENTPAFNISFPGSLIIDVKTYTTEGIYFCQNSTLHLGNVFYRLTSKEECKDVTIAAENINRSEGQNVILKCSQSTDDRVVIWYKDDEELKHFSKNMHKLPDKGLYLKNVQLSDEGIYTCKAILKRGGNLCGKTSFVYELTVTGLGASSKSDCGKTVGIDTIYKPWLVMLQHDDELIPFCYGALLNSRWIITSAVCLSNLRRKKVINVSVYFSTNDTDKNYKVETVKIHPGYQNQLHENNIALAKLRIEGKFSSRHRPICFENVNRTKKERCDDTPLTAFVSGWGSLLVNDTDYMTLDVEVMSLVKRNKCRTLSSDTFCFENSDYSSYPGDSGSPLFVDYKGRNYLLGIFNWGERRAGVGVYDYFTDVQYHYDWISEVTL